jgi:hypothetical protein
MGLFILFGTPCIMTYLAFFQSGWLLSFPGGVLTAVWAFIWINGWIFVVRALRATQARWNATQDRWDA